MSENIKISVDVVSGKQKKDPSKEWRAVSIKIGDWSKLIFPDSKFEMDYIEKVIEANK